MKLFFQKNVKGFSLVELLVVVTIIAILSVGATIGFGQVGDVLKSKQVVNFIQDNIKQSELQVLAGDFETVTIHFLDDYLIIEQQPEDVTLDLSLSGSCLQYGDDGNLIKKNQDEALITVTTKSSGGSDCIDADFVDTEDREWSYQLTQGVQISPLIRFVHFNLNRENLPLTNPLVIGGDMDSKLQIEAPYSKKSYFDDLGASVTSLTLEINDSDNSFDPETLTLQ